MCPAIPRVGRSRRNLVSPAPARVTRQHEEAPRFEQDILDNSGYLSRESHHASRAETDREYDDAEGTLVDVLEDASAGWIVVHDELIRDP